MDQKQLEIFMSVMENRSFSGAAKKLYLSQPTVSTHIAALERELGAKLIMRTTKELYPSGAGLVFYDYAKRMLSLQREAGEAVARLSGGTHGTVAVAASTVPYRELLPGLIGAFNKKYADVSIRVQLTDSQGAVDMVGKHMAEIGFCGTRLSGGKLVFEEIAGDSIAVAAPDIPRYRAYLADGFPPRQVEGEPVISREKGSGTRRETERYLKEMGVDCSRLRIVESISSNDAILARVKEGKGIAMLSRRFLDGRAPVGFISMDFQGARLRRRLYMIRNRKIELSPAARVFYDFAANRRAKL